MKSDVISHYDILIDEGNDPFFDPPFLQEYMDKWDGQCFIDKMNIDKTKSVLEIGVGTGRLARKVAPLCKTLTGIDISPKTVERAKKNLDAFGNISLICDDFLSHEFFETFDIIYSSLTFMHIEQKQFAIKKICSLLNESGVFALSIDKNQSEFLEFGNRKIKVYPDEPERIAEDFSNANMIITDRYETDFACIFISKRK